jgi:hypothetical protein
LKGAVGSRSSGLLISNCFVGKANERQNVLIINKIRRNYPSRAAGFT